MPTFFLCWRQLRGTGLFLLFFFNCSKTHKIYHFTAFLFIRLSCCGPGEALSLIVRTLTALSGLPCALPEWASLQPSRTQWLAPVVDPGPTCYNPSLLIHIVQSSNCLMLFLCFHIFGDVLFTACHLTEGRNYFFISSPPSFLSQCSSIAGIEYFGGTVDFVNCWWCRWFYWYELDSLVRAAHPLLL